MSEYDRISGFVGQYTDSELADYARQYGFHQSGMSRTELIDGVTQRLVESGYTVTGTPSLRQLGYTAGASGGSRGGSPRRSGRSPRRSKSEPEPTPADCGANQYYREAFQRSGFTRRFLDQQIQVAPHYVRAACVSFPRDNPWWHEVSRFSQQTGLSAAEAAKVLSENGLDAAAAARDPRIERASQLRAQSPRRRSTQRRSRSPRARRQQGGDDLLGLAGLGFGPGRGGRYQGGAGMGSPRSRRFQRSGSY